MESLIPALCPLKVPHRKNEKVKECNLFDSCGYDNCKLKTGGEAEGLIKYRCVECNNIYELDINETNLTCRQDGCGGIIKLITS